MKVYNVEYTTCDWSKDSKVVAIVAPSVLKAVQEVMKKKYTSYGGEVKSVLTVLTSVAIAK